MKSRRQLILRACLISLLGALLGILSFPALSTAVTPAGTIIDTPTRVSCMEGRYTFRFSPNPAPVTVLTVHGVAIDTLAQGSVKQGKSVAFVHTVTNKGNVADVFAVSASTSSELALKLFAADGVTPLSDSDGDGKPDTAVVPAGGVLRIVVKLTVPSTAKPGDLEKLTVQVTSTAEQEVTASVEDTAKVADFWIPLVKTVAPSGQAAQGTLLTYTCSFGSDVDIPATKVLISDPLDANLDFVEGSATLPAGINDAGVTYDAATRTVSWTVPSMPAGYHGSVSFKARINAATVSDTTIYNSFSVASDQNPDPQLSKKMQTPVVEQPLRITKSVVGRTEAEIGDFVSYAVTVENVSKALKAVNVEVIDTLPRGFRYARGSSLLDGVPLSDPSPATSVRWSIGSLEPGKMKTLAYRTLVSVDAPRGDSFNYAVALGKSPAGNNLFSPSAAAKVKIVEGVLNDKSIILGRVFVDQNLDRMPDADEPGLKGVRLYLENGFYAVTDAEGKFSIVGVDPGEHVLKLDRTTLPPGFEPEPLDTSFAGDGSSRFLTVPFGGPARGDFGVRKLPEAAAPRTEQAKGTAAERVYTFSFGGTNGTPPLEEQIRTMPDTPEILEPAAGTDLRKPWTDVVVRVPEGSDFTLRVNGTEIPQTQIGKTIVERARKIRICQFVSVKVDPGVSKIVLEVTRPQGEPELREIEVTAPGEPEKLEIRAGRTDIPADGKTLVPFTVTFLDKAGRQVNDDIVYTVVSGKGEIVEPDLDPAKEGHQLKAAGGKGTFTVRSTERTGAELVQVSAGTNLKDGVEVFFTPQMRDWVVAGIGSVTAGFNSVSGNTQNVTDDDHFEKGMDLDGRIALFAKGSVLDRYLITAAFDSKKEEQKDLFQRVPPDRYYTIYGDASAQGYEAESRKKYYARIERDRSYLLVGDFATYLSTNEFTRYDRSFNGVKADIDTRNATLRAFGTSTSHTALKEEIPGNGTSGYYFLNHSPIVENSDKVRIEVRDRYHSERVLSATEKLPYADYSLDYRTGALLFREPVPSYDASLNPVRIVILYESEVPGAENHIYGGRGALRADQGSEIGVTAVVEETGANSNTLFGADAAWKINDKSSLKMEAAQSHTNLKGDGFAWKTELAARVQNALIDAYYRRVDRDFQNPSMTGNEAGTEKYGGKVTYPLMEKTNIIGEGFVHSDLINSKKLTYSSLGLSQGWRNLRFDTGYRYVKGEDDDGELTTSQMLLAGVSGKITPKLEASILQEQAFTSQTVRDYPSRTLLKLNYKLTERTSAFVTDEIVESGKNRGNNALMGLSTKLYENVIVTTTYKESAGASGDRQLGTELSSRWEPSKVLSIITKTGYQLQDSMTGGRGQALLGVDTSWEALKGLRIGAKAERVQLVTGNSDPNGVNTALALSVAYLGAEAVKASARYEFRDSPGETAHLSSLGGAWKVNRNLSLLGKATLWTSDKGTGNDVLFDGEAGAAYRPPGRDSLYLLSVLRFKQDSKLSTPTGGERESLIGSVEVSDRLTPNLTLHGKYAGKFSWDSLAGRQVQAYSDMLLAGASYDVTTRLDLALYAKLMNQYDSGVTSVGVIPEAGFRVIKNVRLAIGYNYSKVNDRDLAGEGYSGSGPYAQLKFKFDEKTIEDIYAGVFGKPEAAPAPPPEPLKAVVKAELAEEPVQVVGSVAGPKLLVNDREAALQTAEMKLLTETVEDMVDVTGSVPDQPLQFLVEASSPKAILSWSAVVATEEGDTVRTLAGTGAPPLPVNWDLRDDSGDVVKGGEIYRYRAEIDYVDGSRVTSPYRLLGLNRSSLVSATLNGKAFKTGSAELSRKARGILKDVAAMLRRHPEEKIVVEGHCDALENDLELSRRRSQGAAGYLVQEQGIAAARVETRWYGSSRPLAGNALAEGREMNRRVEIRGSYAEAAAPAILDQHREEPFVTVNGWPVAVDDLGRFTDTVAEEGESFEVEMETGAGRSVKTSLALPQLALVEPAGGEAQVVCPDEDGAGEGRALRIPYRFVAKTSPGHTAALNGESVPVADDGSFSFTINLAEGESSYWLQLRDGTGFGRDFRLKVNAAREQQPPPKEGAPR